MAARGGAGMRLDVPPTNGGACNRGEADVAWSGLASHLRLAIAAGVLLAGGCVVIDGDLFDAGTRDPRPGQEPVDDNAGDPSGEVDAGAERVDDSTGDPGGEVDAGAEPDAAVDARGQSPLEPSAGCGKRGAKTGTFDKKITSGGKSRTFTLTVPGAYDPSVPYRVVVGFHGRDWTGAKMRPYLNLERYSDGKVLFVYPWAQRNGAYIGWQLGPYASRFGGNEDLVFFDDMLADLANEYCIDRSLARLRHRPELGRRHDAPGGLSARRPRARCDRRGG